MHCRYHAAGACRSCTSIVVPYDVQLATKAERARRMLDPEGRVRWLPPVANNPSGFRNKAKMVVAGTVDDPTLGILDVEHGGVDLRDCLLYTPGIHAALPVLARHVAAARLTPYDVTTRQGELKHLLLTESPDGELMLRYVLRSTEAVARLRKHLPALRTALPALAVVSANILPEHAAVLEGEREIPLTTQETLRMRLGDVDLHLRPQSFFQTSTGTASALYRQAQDWLGPLRPALVWDLYCGVGGFALHLAAPGREVVGVETSAQAVESARLSASDAGLAGVRFEVGDATAFAVDRLGHVVGADADAGAAPPHRRGASATPSAPDAVVVNPPRRGIGAVLAEALERSAARHIVYSSCNPVSLAADLARMPSLRAREARLFDMFPHTGHCEVMVLLER